MQKVFLQRLSLRRSHASALALSFAAVMAAIMGAALLKAPTADAALSNGCTFANSPFFDSLYYSAGPYSGLTFAEGERLTVEARLPSSWPNRGIRLFGTDAAGNPISFSTGYPGTLVYDFPVSGVYRVGWGALDANVTWQITCDLAPPPPASPGCEDRCNDGGAPPKPAAARIIVCGPTGASNIEYSQWTDPDSPYYDLALPRYAAAAGGATCDALPGYAPTGQFTDGFGSFTAEQNTKLGDGVYAPYPVWTSAKD
jgi:hypothetical protein